MSSQDSKSQKKKRKNIGRPKGSFDKKKMAQAVANQTIEEFLKTGAVSKETLSKLTWITEGNNIEVPLYKMLLNKQAAKALIEGDTKAFKAFSDDLGKSLDITTGGEKFQSPTVLDLGGDNFKEDKSSDG